MRTWEYYSEAVKAKLDKRMLRLNELGAEGWELVSVDGTTAYFKRQVS